MTPVEIIRKKRDGQKLSANELKFFIQGYVEGNIADYQMSSFLMAVYFNKMDFEETAVLTDIMLKSGIIVDLSSIPGIKVDKHSTGGVGDKVSLILAPLVAACGVPVPMISGRGLGHTGGTLDKLESIPGFRTNLTLDEYKSVIANTGLVMIGQTNEIAPADKKMYALRDVTGTVECIPLIAGSIMSKKLAEGIDALVLDIKTGRGAFMQSKESAIELAQTLIAIGNKFGKNTIGFLTDMSQPLGYAVGNWVEVVESVECLRGKNVQDLMEITYLLSSAMLVLGEKAKTIDKGIAICKNTISSGKAYEKFLEMVEKQGGNKSFIEDLNRYPKSKFKLDIKSNSTGNIQSIDALEVGFVSIIIGAGRTKVDDIIDPKAGIIFYKKAGDFVTQGDIIATLYADANDKLVTAARRLEKAILITTEPTVVPPLIHAFIDKYGVHNWR